MKYLRPPFAWLVFASLAGLALFTHPGLADEKGTAPKPKTLPKFADLKSQVDLPDPLTFLDGTKVETPKQWQDRAAELKQMFQHYMYGYLPEKPKKTHIEELFRDDTFLDGKATLQEFAITFEDPKLSRPLYVLLATPKGVKQPPVFVGMNFCGNHELAKHEKIHIPDGWVYASCVGAQNEKSTEKGRGGDADKWNLDLIVERGYALASFYSGDLDADTPDFKDGIISELLPGGPMKPYDAGAVAEWAWGYHRVVDFLVEHEAKNVDVQRIAAVGHSRNGKTTLLAAALDERIALAIPHQAGCGGTAPSRGKIGESVKQINDRFPHWFCDEFTKFNDATDRLPFDQHCLLALMAPRPVLLSNAQEDQWANPSGQFDLLLAADPVYKLLGSEGLAPDASPDKEKLTKSPLGFFLRSGKHSMNREDWQAFLDYADAYFKQDRATP
ncbi:MAG: acetylxylan esterase [Planctomycetaceae bacterium]